MPPSTWSTPRRSRPSQRWDDAVDSGGSGCPRALFGGGWAAGGDGDTASGGVALAGGALRQGPGDQCHHQSHLPPPRPWRGSSPSLHQGSVGVLSGGDSPARLIAKGGVERPGGMAGGQAIVQRLDLRSQGHLFRAGLTEGSRAKGQGKALRCLGQQVGQQLQWGQAGLRGVLPAARASAGRTARGRHEVVIIQVGWRLQQPQQSFGIDWADLLQRDAVLLVPQTNQGGPKPRVNGRFKGGLRTWRRAVACSRHGE